MTCHSDAPQSTDFVAVSDLLTDEEREESLRIRVAELTESAARENVIILDLGEFCFLLRLLDEARAERDAMQRDFDDEGRSAYEAGQRVGYEARMHEERNG